MCWVLVRAGYQLKQSGIVASTLTEWRKTGSLAVMLGSYLYKYMCPCRCARLSASTSQGASTPHVRPSARHIYAIHDFGNLRSMTRRLAPRRCGCVCCTCTAQARAVPVLHRRIYAVEGTAPAYAHTPAVNIRSCGCLLGRPGDDGDVLPQ